MSAGQEYADLRGRGIAPQNAAVGAVGVGTVESATEAWPTRALWDMMKPAARGSFVKLGNKMVELYGAELVGESAATFFQDVIDKVYTKPDMTPAEVRQVLTEYVDSGEAWVNFIDTVKSTAIQTTLMGGQGQVPIGRGTPYRAAWSAPGRRGKQGLHSARRREGRDRDFGESRPQHLPPRAGTFMDRGTEG